MAERMFSPKEVAELWSVDEKTVRRLISRRALRAVKVGRLLRVPDSALSEVAEAQPGSLTGLSKTPKPARMRNRQPVSAGTVTEMFGL